MSLKTAVTIALVGTALSVLRDIGVLVGGEAFVKFLYWENTAIARALHLLFPLTLLIFFVVLRTKQK